MKSFEHQPGQPNQRPDSPQEAIPSQRRLAVSGFDDARALKKEFGANTVLGLINRDLKGPDGEPAMLFKIYLDQVMPDAAERDLCHQPEAIGRMHVETAQMISENLRIWAAGKTAEEKAVIKQRKEAYQERLKRDSETWGGLQSEIAAASPGKESWPLHQKAAKYASYHGLRMPTTNGEEDISGFDAGKITGIRANIRIQRGFGAPFVHWETDAVSAAKLRQEDVKLTKRIYLNPKTGAHIRVFTELMRALNEAGVIAQGKVLDRSIELANHDPDQSIRADAIVLVVDEAGAEQAFKLVRQLYENEPDTFAGRATPKIPKAIAPGLAVGSESAINGESLTSHRERVIQEAVTETKKRLGLNDFDKVPKGKEQAALDMFQKQVWPEVAKRNGVDPENLAFNL